MVPILRTTCGTPPPAPVHLNPPPPPPRPPPPPPLPPQSPYSFPFLAPSHAAAAAAAPTCCPSAFLIIFLLLIPSTAGPLHVRLVGRPDALVWVNECAVSFQGEAGPLDLPGPGQPLAGTAKFNTLSELTFLLS